MTVMSSLTGALFLCGFVSCGEASLHQRSTSFVPPISQTRSSPASCLPRLAPLFPEGNNRQCETALGMGLRSFLKKKVLRRGDDENEDQDEGDVEPWLGVDEEESIQEDEEGVAVVDERELEWRRDREETVQDRINRLKSGRMTEDEKAAFLRTTLSQASLNSTTSSDGGQPLRQRIPSPDDPETQTRKESASPFPTDSILKNTFARVKSVSNRRSSLPPPELDSDRKKREYLEMVTNPNRFKSYITAEEPSAPLDSFISYDDDDDMDTSALSPEDVTAADASKAPPIGSPGLASRLEAAASANEIRKRDIQKQQEEEKQKQLQKLAEIQRMRNEEMAKREMEALERKRQQEEALQRAEEERRAAEEEQQRKMMEAQEAYWKNKLAEERQKQRERLSNEEKEELAKKTAEEKERERAQKVIDIQQEQERSRLREAEREREDPHEGKILKEAEEKKTHDREETWELTEQAAARVKGTAPSLDVPDVSSNSFLNQQAQQKAAIDKEKDAQLAQLKSMNSPLPSPIDKSKPPSVTPAMQQGRQVPVQTSSRRMSSIADFSLGAGKARKDSSPEQPAAKTVKEIMAEMDDEDYDEDEQGIKKSSGGGSALGGLGRMLMGNQNNAKEAAKKPVRQPLPNSNKRKVVRQQIPTGDNDDDDFDAFARNGPKKGMSIGDAMEEAGGKKGGEEDPVARSKRFGIDISKFQD